MGSNRETVLFLLETGRNEDKRILLEAAEPAAVPTVEALIENLVKDPHCQAICLVADNVAVESFRGKSYGGYVLHEIKGGRGIFENAPGPFDVAVAIVGPENSPTSFILYSARSVFDAHKFLYVTGGLQSSSASIFTSPNRVRMDPVDEVLVDDELAAELYRIRMPWFEKNQIVPTGTALMDEVRKEDGEGLRASGRRKLGISSATHTLFFSGFPGADFKEAGGHPDLQLLTLAEALEGARFAASANPTESYVVLVRLHPRSPDKENTRLLSLCEWSTPKNLRIVTDTSVATYVECVYASDLVAVMSTSSLVNLSRYRGRTALVFAFEGEGGSRFVFDRLFTEPEAKIIKRVPGIVLAHNAEDVARYLSSAQPIPRTELPDGNSVQNILAHIF